MRLQFADNDRDQALALLTSIGALSSLGGSVVPADAPKSQPVSSFPIEDVPV
ncbi:MAG TPA: hypothetical protein VNQ79_15900 [Blastocatellia bacterium]|nr:hypothetical protein [Blastocatellia bacterium]